MMLALDVVRLGWDVAQLIFWVACMVAVVGAFAAIALVPPYFAARYLYRRFT